MSLSKFEEALLNAMIESTDIRTACEIIVRKGILTKRGKVPDPPDCYDALGNIRRKFKKSRSYVGVIFRFIQKDERLRKHLIPNVPMDIKEDKI